MTAAANPSDRAVVVVSNRGPVSFDLVDGRPVGRRGAGGLTSGLGPLVRGTDALWFAAAMTDGDRTVAAAGITATEGFNVGLLDLDPETWNLHYDAVCNEALQIRPRYLDALDSRGFVSLKLGQPSRAIADYDLALQINPKHASSLYGRGIAKLRSGNTSGGNNDIAASKAIQPDIAEEFASYGVR